jgi:hypothetical protein
MCVNKLILGDNLEILKTMESETIKLKVNGAIERQ